MRVLITAQAGYGHFVPLIPLATALRAAGHDVWFGTSERCRDGLAAHGLELDACGPAWLESDFGRSSEPHNPVADLAKFLEAELLASLLKDFEASVRRRRPDVILSNDFEPVGRVIAERARIPFVLASSGPRLSRAFREQRHTYLLKTARRLAGLPEGGDLDWSLRWLHLCFAPRDWAFLGSIYDAGSHVEAPNEHGIRPRVADLGRADGVRVASRPDARPAVLCTFGTVFTHAGAGTLTALQLQGKPSLLLPQGADQPVNAAACVRNGSSVVRFHTLAAITAGVPVPKEPMTEDSVAEAFAELLADPGYRERAERFRASFDALPSVEHAVRLIEKLAVTRAPVLASH